MSASHGLVDRARQRFKDLAASCVARCELQPEMARAVLHSLELGFAQTIKEDGPLMHRRFDQDVEGAVAWVTQRLVEANRELAADTPGRKRSSLQSLASLEVEALEFMLPELSQTVEAQAAEGSIPAAQLQSFCFLLNDGLDFAQKAESAAARHDEHAYQSNYVLSRNKLRHAAAMLRRMLREAASETSDLAAGLHGFQLELAASAGSVRMFLKALRARTSASQWPRAHTHAIDPHCLVCDLLPVVFDRHFAFTIHTPRGVPARKSQELMDAAHGAMWQKVAQPIATLLAQPEEWHPGEFKDAVETELRKAIKEVNQEYAAEEVTVSITSNNVKTIRRRAW